MAFVMHGALTVRNMEELLPCCAGHGDAAKVVAGCSGGRAEVVCGGECCGGSRIVG